MSNDIRLIFLLFIIYLRTLSNQFSQLTSKCLKRRLRHMSTTWWYWYLMHLISLYCKQELIPVIFDYIYIYIYYEPIFWIEICKINNKYLTMKWTYIDKIDKNDKYICWNHKNLISFSNMFLKEFKWQRCILTLKKTKSAQILCLKRQFLISITMNQVNFHVCTDSTQNCIPCKLFFSWFFFSFIRK